MHSTMTLPVQCKRTIRTAEIRPILWLPLCTLHCDAFSLVLHYWDQCVAFSPSYSTVLFNNDFFWGGMPIWYWAVWFEHLHKGPNRKHLSPCSINSPNHRSQVSSSFIHSVEKYQNYKGKYGLFSRYLWWRCSHFHLFLTFLFSKPCCFFILCKLLSELDTQKNCRHS